MSPPSALVLPHWLDTAARNHPGKLALAFGSERWTFSELRESADAAATRLAAAIGDRGGRLGILSVNRPGFVFAIHAATRLGVPFVPLNWRQTRAEIAWQIEDAGITTLVIDEEWGDGAGAGLVRRMVEIVPMGELEQTPSSLSPSNPHPNRHPEGTRPIAMGEGLPARQAVLLPFTSDVRTIALDREAAVLYTSATSGRPKGARITYGNLWFSAVGSALHLGCREDDVWLAAMPLFHIGGLSILFRGVIGAAPVILHGRFDPATSLQAIADGATLVSVVPAMLQRMIEIRGETPWPETLRCVLLGGSSTPSRLVEDCLRLGIPVAPTYGLTEASSQVTTLHPDQVRDKKSSSGLPLPLTDVRIATSAGRARAGETGEIEIKGPTLFAGYLHESNGASGRTVDGWFPTGDAGYLDEDGYLVVVDRRDDLIVSGGENIYPAEIERVLREHPMVVDAGVVGLSDESWGDRPAAAVVWGGDPALAQDELRRHCEQRLASYKVPDRFVVLAELPRSASGKLLRRTLKEMLGEQLGMSPNRTATDA